MGAGTDAGFMVAEGGRDSDNKSIGNQALLVLLFHKLIKTIT